MALDLSKTNELLKQFYTERAKKQLAEMQAQQQAYDTSDYTWGDVIRTTNPYWSSNTIPTQQAYPTYYGNTDQYNQQVQQWQKVQAARSQPMPTDFREIFPDMYFHRADEGALFNPCVLMGTFSVRLMIAFWPHGGRETAYLAEPDPKLSNKEHVVFDLPPVTGQTHSIRMDPKLVINNVIFDYSYAVDKEYHAHPTGTPCYFSFPRKALKVVQMDLNAIYLMKLQLRKGEAIVRYYEIDKAANLIHCEVYRPNTKEVERLRVPFKI